MRAKLIKKGIKESLLLCEKVRKNKSIHPHGKSEAICLRWRTMQTRERDDFRGRRRTHFQIHTELIGMQHNTRVWHAYKEQLIRSTLLITCASFTTFWRLFRRLMRGKIWHIRRFHLWHNAYIVGIKPSHLWATAMDGIPVAPCQINASWQILSNPSCKGNISQWVSSISLNALFRPSVMRNYDCNSASLWGFFLRLISSLMICWIHQTKVAVWCFYIIACSMKCVHLNPLNEPKSTYAVL